jgi:hypothetical protein
VLAERRAQAAIQSAIERIQEASVALPAHLLALLHPFQLSKGENTHLPSADVPTPSSLFGLGRTKSQPAATTAGPLSPRSQDDADARDHEHGHQLSNAPQVMSPQGLGIHGDIGFSSLPRNRSLGEYGLRLPCQCLCHTLLLQHLLISNNYHCCYYAAKMLLRR